MFAAFGIVTIVISLLGAGAAAGHVAENGLHVDIPAAVSK